MTTMIVCHAHVVTQATFIWFWGPHCVLKTQRECDCNGRYGWLEIGDVIS